MMLRRSFTKVLAATLMCPLLKLQPTIDRHKLLAMFTGDDAKYRWDLSRPYIVDDFAYATDARIMARITTSEPEYDIDQIKKPPVADAWNELFKPTDWKPFRLADYGELVLAEDNPVYGGTCPMCDDRRVSFGPNYPTEDIAEDLPNYDPDDNTIRDVTCPMCRGEDYYGGNLQMVNGHLLAYRYAKKLAAVPGCEICIAEWCEPKRTNASAGFLFRSDVGISGIAMPVVCKVTKRARQNDERT